MRQVFQNLIDNAVKYMDRAEGGRICVGHQRVGRLEQFYVQDNGPGIRTDQQAEIFTVFRRAREEASSQVEGKGVGLAVVRQVVANYRGQAWVESEPGRGATFYFTLENVREPAQDGGSSDLRPDDDGPRPGPHPTAGKSMDRGRIGDRSDE